jgi:hypothetical protein
MVMVDRIINSIWTAGGIAVTAWATWAILTNDPLSPEFTEGAYLDAAIACVLVVVAIARALDELTRDRQVRRNPWAQ